MWIIVVAIAALGVGVISYRGATGYKDPVPVQESTPPATGARLAP